MKNLLFVFACSCITMMSMAQKRSGAIEPVRPLANCTCDAIAPTTNMWIENNTGNERSYVLEIQFPIVSGCTVTTDSLYFLTRVHGLAQDRFNAFSEFAKIMEKQSSDKKWRVLRYRIPKNLFAIAPVLNQPLSVYYKLRIGTRVCTPTNNLNITDELL